jgi:hypothetical protein
VARTSTAAVQEVLDSEYNGTTSLTPSVDSATVVVDQVVTCAAAKGITISAGQAELIERWLACFFYQAADPGYTNRSTLNKSGGFINDSGDFLNRFLRRAALIDTSGCLTAIFKRQTASIAWGGKTVSEKLMFEDRN